MDTSEGSSPSKRSTEAMSTGPLEDIPLNEPEKPFPEREDLSGLGKGRKWALFACSCVLQFLLQLDMASVAVTLPVWSRQPSSALAP